MPLKKAACGSKRCLNKAVSSNMHELSSSAAKHRPQQQKIAIAISAAKKKR